MASFNSCVFHYSLLHSDFWQLIVSAVYSTKETVPARDYTKQDFEIYNILCINITSMLSKPFTIHILLYGTLRVAYW